MHSSFVNIINLALAANVFTAGKYAKGIYYLIAELATHGEDGTIPMVIPDGGNSTPVIVDDNYPIQIYHRHISSSYADSPDSFGSGSNEVIETANMKMILIADRERLEHTKSELVDGCVYGFPDNFTDANTTAYDYVSYVKATVNSANLDSSGVYSEEYGIDGELPPSYVMASIDYDLAISVNKNCYTLCT